MFIPWVERSFFTVVSGERMRELLRETSFEESKESFCFVYVVCREIFEREGCEECVRMRAGVREDLRGEMGVVEERVPWESMGVCQCVCV
ncbi:hypothetical protein COLO4_13793 [Corchorus olitorius]|uniref:Uncharacterized protein n=1 Tax=Corchorus olitorius TaxID=93759 RepID=A0A1R3JVA8_9ROSI|nr:hypothetical protein COLO4_13793 [Corchorus olitorius]